MRKVEKPAPDGEPAVDRNTLPGGDVLRGGAALALRATAVGVSDPG
jgi:hypothetical protein